MSEDFVVADAARIDRILDRMARELAARIDETWALVGIRRRGVPLAERIAERLPTFQETAPETAELELKRYSDDLEVLHLRPTMDAERFDLDVEGRSIVLVDDVLYTGRTLFRAAGYLADRGADAVVPVVLCRRGHPELPVLTAVEGVHIDLGPDRLIDVHLPPYEPDPAIVLRERP